MMGLLSVLSLKNVKATRCELIREIPASRRLIMFSKKPIVFCISVLCLVVLLGLAGCKSNTLQDTKNYAITAGPDGNLWYTDNLSNKIGKISPSTGNVTQYIIPTDSAYPIGIAPGPDGNLWFTEDLANKIGKISPATGSFTEYNIINSV